MGLLTIIKKVRRSERTLRLLILGLDNAGKTTILKKFNGQDITTIEPTLGFDIKTLEHNGYRLNCWDVGGQSTIRSYWRNYFEETDALIWVVDSADPGRFSMCREELSQVLKQEKLSGATVLIFANKQVSGAAERVVGDLGRPYVVSLVVPTIRLGVGLVRLGSPLTTNHKPLTTNH